MARLFLTDDRHEVLERRRHAASGAYLLLIRLRYLTAIYRQGYVVGWTGLNGLTKGCVARLKPFDSTETARDGFEAIFAGGPAARPARTPDRQRARLYRWEIECLAPRFADEDLLSLKDCQSFVDEVWKSTGQRRPPPRVKDGRGRRRAGARRAYLTMPRWTRQRHQLLHEVAHTLTDDRHGPHFVRAYVDLLDRHLGISAARAEAELSEMGVQAAPSGESALPGPGGRPGPARCTVPCPGTQKSSMRRES